MVEPRCAFTPTVQNSRNKSATAVPISDARTHVTKAVHNTRSFNINVTLTGRRSSTDADYVTLPASILLRTLRHSLRVCNGLPGRVRPVACGREREAPCFGCRILRNRTNVLIPAIGASTAVTIALTKTR